jgi:hypothetical protein
VTISLSLSLSLPPPRLLLERGAEIFNNRERDGRGVVGQYVNIGYYWEEWE